MKKEVGIRNTTRISAPQRTLYPSNRLNPPASSMRPVTATASVGAGTPALPAYCAYPESFVRWLKPEKKKNHGHGCRPSSKVNWFIRLASVCGFAPETSDGRGWVSQIARHLRR